MTWIDYFLLVLAAVTPVGLLIAGGELPLFADAVMHTTAGACALALAGGLESGYFLARHDVSTA